MFPFSGLNTDIHKVIFCDPLVEDKLGHVKSNFSAILDHRRWLNTDEKWGVGEEVCTRMSSVIKTSISNKLHICFQHTHDTPQTIAIVLADIMDLDTIINHGELFNKFGTVIFTSLVGF